jgi:hypothetical protein
MPRVPECLSLRPNWLPPSPSSSSEVSTPLEPTGVTHSLAGEAAGGGTNADDWRESLALCLLCAYEGCLLCYCSVGFI